MTGLVLNLLVLTLTSVTHYTIIISCQKVLLRKSSTFWDHNFCSLAVFGSVVHQLGKSALISKCAQITEATAGLCPKQHLFTLTEHTTLFNRTVTLSAGVKD